jgi:hypothetical protein
VPRAEHPDLRDKDSDRGEADTRAYRRLGERSPRPPISLSVTAGWTGNDFMQAYITMMSMFLYCAREVDDQYGADFLEHLQRQAAANELDHDPDADLPTAGL